MPKRSIIVAVTPSTRGVRIKVSFLEDGHCLKTTGTTRLWGKRDAKSPDDLLVRRVAGAVQVELRDWMDQGELPF